jgi:ATP-dependent DNA helicase RecQ
MPITELQIESVLQEKFSLETFRPKQTEVITHVLNGEPTLALLPTGYGKSLCYQLPSQLLPGVTLVVSPLIALMQDQVENLRKRGVMNATVLNSSIALDEQDRRVQGILNGEYKLVYVAPERFESSRFRRLLSKLTISLLVIDEAHCISNWGHDFRPHYRALAGYLNHVPGATILALTATATPIVQKDIVQALKLPDMKVVVGSFDRPNLYFKVIAARDTKHKQQAVLQALQGESDPVIVYTSTKKDAEAVAEFLKDEGIKADFYHAGIPSEKRSKIQRKFELDQIRVIVCTVAFGMGIDKPNIRQVIHYNMPPSLENYYQEAGRAGRDGLPATCTLLFQNKDIITQRWLVDQNYPSAKQVMDILQYLQGGSNGGVRAADIAGSLRISVNALKGAFDLLKHQGMVSSTDDGEYYLNPDNFKTDAIDMSYMLERRRRDEARLQRMIEFAERLSCRRRYVIEYFGQKLAQPCENCDQCRPQEAKKIVPPVAKAAGYKVTSRTDESLNKVILQVVAAAPGRRGRTMVTAIITGSKNKKILENDLQKHPQYGVFTGMKQERVMAAIDALVDDGLLEITRGLYPCLVITAVGKKMLAE